LRVNSLLQQNNSLFVFQNSLFLSVGNFDRNTSEDKVFLAASRRLEGQNRRNSLYFPCLAGNFDAESSSQQTAPSTNFLLKEFDRRYTEKSRTYAGMFKLCCRMEKQSKILSKTPLFKKVPGLKLGSSAFSKS